MTLTRLFIALSLCCLLFAPVSVQAAPYMVISASGEGEFALFGNHMYDVVGMHIVINYDVSTMANASVSPTTILLAHCRVTSRSSEGTVELTATGKEPVGERGNVVMLNFEPRSEDIPGRIVSASVYLTASNGAQSTVPVLIDNPQPRPKLEEDLPDRWSAAREAAASGKAPSVAAPLPEQGAKRDVPAGEGTRADSGGSARVVERSERSQEAAYNEQRCTSLLDRVTSAGAAGSVAALLPLVAAKGDCPFSQMPRALLSDGKSPVTVTMELDVKGERAPNFLIEGAHCLSLSHSGTAWELKLLPEAGGEKASVAALYDDRMITFPLAVAPPAEVYRSRRVPARPELDAYVELVNMWVQGVSR